MGDAGGEGATGYLLILKGSSGNWGYGDRITSKGSPATCVYVEWHDKGGNGCKALCFMYGFTLYYRY